MTWKTCVVLTAVLAVCLVPTASADQYLIELNGAGGGDLAAAVTAAGGSLAHAMPEIGYASAISNDPGFAKKLAKASGVKKVHLDMEVQWQPTEAGFEAMSAPSAAGHVTPPAAAFFFPCQWNMTQVDAPGAWGLGEFGTGSVVAVLDSGVSGDPAFGGGAPHVDMVGRLVGNVTAVSVDNPTCAFFGASDSTSPLDYRFHGTFVAGIIAANGFAVAGVAPDASILGVKVLNCLGSGTFSDVIAGILIAANDPRVDVINMSLGAYFPKNLPGGGPLVAAITKAVNYAQGVQGKLVVSASGNDFADLDHDGNFVSLPAQAGSGIAAWSGAVDGSLASYSNHGHSGAWVGAGGGDFTPGAPLLPGCVLPPTGHDAITGVCSGDSIVIPGCGPGSVLFNGSGTSFSAPLVSGVAALAKSRFPGMNGNQLKTHLKNTADDIGPVGADNLFSHGRVNAKSAVQ